MNLNELNNKVAEWYESLNGCEPTTEDINDFCNMNATSYEEYMTLWHIMSDSFEIEN